MAFVTLEEFFDNYRIKNQQQPNETVLNRGLLRLKRETRELKSILDLLVGNPIPTWNENKIYEQDEYITFNSIVYKSLQDVNYANTPELGGNEWWDITTVASGGGSGSKLFYHNVEATEGQVQFVTPFSMNSTPMIFIEGVLLDESRYNKISNIEIELIIPAQAGEQVVITSGITYDASAVISKQQFTATAGQYIFETDFEIKNPSVFLDGTLLAESEYTYQTDSVELETPLAGDEIVVIGNGSILGADIYTTSNIDALLADKRDISDSYSQTEIDADLLLKSDLTYVDGEFAAVRSEKADVANSLAGYGILDAYTQTAADALLDLKMDFSFFTDEIVMQKVQNLHGDGSGLDADLLDGLQSTSFMRSDEASLKIDNLGIVELDGGTGLKSKEIILDVNADTPEIRLVGYDASEAVETTATVYTDANTSQMMIIKEGYFKGAWEPTLDTDFGIANYEDYNWSIIVTPVLTGFEHDYNASFVDGHTPYTGFDNNLSWDSNQSEYHYGYIENEIVKLDAFHKNGSNRIDIPARYHLMGVVKTFSSYEFVNQP
jgi:hypothetical protein